MIIDRHIRPVVENRQILGEGPKDQAPGKVPGGALVSGRAEEVESAGQVGVISGVRTVHKELAVSAGIERMYILTFAYLVTVCLTWHGHRGWQSTKDSPQPVLEGEMLFDKSDQRHCGANRIYSPTVLRYLHAGQRTSARLLERTFSHICIDIGAKVSLSNDFHYPFFTRINTFSYFKNGIYGSIIAKGVFECSMQNCEISE